LSILKIYDGGKCGLLQTDKIWYYYNMERIDVNKFKSRLNEIIEKVNTGVAFAIISNEDQVIGYFIPPSQFKAPKRKLGLLAGAEVKFADDFKMTEKEFLGK
jgi:hypothetical protein